MMKKNFILALLVVVALLSACVDSTPDDAPSSETVHGDDKDTITISFNLTGNETGDSVSASPASGKVGNEITINYTLANTKLNNRLAFSGTTATINEVDSAGNGTKKYTIVAGDATDGVITINAIFTHSDKTLNTIAFADTNNETKTYGDASFTKAITNTGSGTGAITYASSDETVATVNNTGAVTILKAGQTTITATKAADTTYEHATAEYLLTVEQLQLTIETPTDPITKTYDGTTTATVIVGALTNTVGTDTVNVSATGTYASADAGDNIVITVVYSIDGTNAGNYIKPVDDEITGSITKADGAAVNTNPTMVSKTHNSITSSVVTTSGGQTVEYAINTNNHVPSDGWQDGQLFSGLTPSTGYYIFARSKESNNYNAGEAKLSSEITTDAPPLVFKYNFGDGDTLPDGYPKYSDVGTGSGNTFTAVLDTSNSPSVSNFYGKTVLRVSKNYNGGSARFILPFNLGDKTLADFNAILVVARGAASGMDHSNKQLRAQIGATSTQIGITDNNGFSLDNNATNTATNGVIIPITIANANTYTGSIEIGFYINSANQLNYEILSIMLIPSSSSPGYNFAAGDTITGDYPKLGFTSNGTATVSGGVSSNILTVNKAGANNTTASFLLPFDIGTDNLSDYVGIYIRMRGASPNGGDYGNKGINVYLNTGTSAIGSAGNVGLTTTYQSKFVPLTSSRNADGSEGPVIIGIGLGQTNPYILEIDSIFLIK